jgi:hypothetical protein
MRRRHGVMGIVVLGMVAAMYAQIQGPGLPRNYAFRPAFISTISAPAGHTELVVFPLSGNAFRIPIRSAKPLPLILMAKPYLAVACQILFDRMIQFK